MDSTTNFDKHIDNINRIGAPGSRRWLNPLIDVMDTAEGVKKGIESLGLKVTPEMLVGLTKLVMERENVLYNRDLEADPFDIPD